MSTTPMDVEVKQQSVTKRMKLRGLAQRAAPTRLGALRDFIDTLWPGGEELRIVHHIVRDRQGRPLKYDLDVTLVQSLAARASGNQHVLGTALRCALPSLVFEDVVTGTDGDAPLPPRALIEPAPAIVLPASGAVGYLTGGDGRRFELPYPITLPNWPLTTPFDEPLTGEVLQLELQIRSALLDGETLRRYASVIPALGWGELLAFNAYSETIPQAHDPELATSLAKHLTNWLQSPAPAFTLRIVVRSNESVSTFAVRRIGRAVLGKLPFLIRIPEEHAASLPAPRLVPLKSLLGIGGLIPATDRLEQFNITKIGSLEATTGP